jgi:hypothetical protein
VHQSEAPADVIPHDAVAKDDVALGDPDLDLEAIVSVEG